MVLQADASQLARDAAELILQGFITYHADFKEITRRARQRFERQDWRAAQMDTVERLGLYGKVIQQVVSDTGKLMGPAKLDQQLWNRMKGIYSGYISGRDDLELAETFYNSVTRRIFSTVGVDSDIEYIDSDFEKLPASKDKPIFNTFFGEGSTEALVLRVLEAYPFAVPYREVGRAAYEAGQIINAELAAVAGKAHIDCFEILSSVFYRGKGAYLIGRIRLSSGQKGLVIPLVFALANAGKGVELDAVILTEDEVSILFSFTRSYFHVEAAVPCQWIAFLKSLLPAKRVAELYISIGYNKHGKTELYRDLLRHLKCCDDQFEVTQGERGMVMAVFTMPTYDMVFKVIKDHFSEPKSTTRQEVMSHYQLVFKHDRAGRLVDAQEFEHLEFERSRFKEKLLSELLVVAPSSVRIEGDCVVIKHLYTERRTTPLDIYLREAGEAEGREAVIDYGQAIKDLAATNIFPGDILLKNFGVTRHGRIVFYDYDELTLLTECRFRRMPQAHTYTDEFEAEPWFFVDKNDIFPEEFKTFLGLREPYRELFLDVHSDLFGVEFWHRMQALHRAGEVVDIYPYKQSRRLKIYTN